MGRTMNWTEADWLACKDPGRMVSYLYGITWHRGYSTSRPKVSDRKLRLFACGWCRLMGADMRDAVCQNAVEVAERFADGQASGEELAAAHAPLLECFRRGVLDQRQERSAYAATQEFALNSSSNTTS